jgi:hypothetical protein
VRCKRREQNPLHYCHCIIAIALLPLLMQVQPDMQVLHEHTGIGHKHTHSQNKWHWSVVGNRVLLTNQHMHHFDAFDLKTLLLHAQTAQDSTV